MEGLTSYSFADLVRACAPALQNLLSETTKAPELPLFGERSKEKAELFYAAETLATKKQSCAPLCLSNAPGIARALAQNKRQPLVRLQRRRLHQRRDATEARGAYLLLILDCYATASRNRHDPRRGRQAAGRGVDQEAPFFDISDGYWFHDAEEKHTARIQSARNAIKAR